MPGSGARAWRLRRAWSADAELLRGQPGALDPVPDLLPGGLAGEVGRAVVGLLVDAERREAAIVGRAQLLLRDEAGRPDQGVPDLLRALHPRVQRVDHPDVGHLGHAVGVAAQVLSD